MRLRRATLLVVLALAPVMLTAIWFCSGFVTDFVIDPLPFPDGPPVGFYEQKRRIVSIVQTICPAAFALMLAGIVWLVFRHTKAAHG